ncbi:peptidase S8/S53 domain-containing protein [Phakopsora pachyrhizi]|uniref:Peptidase S8/S53 domain-containing protein n=1 Tax=Phakopsora pachyrhizi TaxID=170000 RepID=A0AAV0B5W3_PHAPC|nr:peptidase S8/S53 domain-containing protein [Phakopsora pachyrhizi]
MRRINRSSSIRTINSSALNAILLLILSILINQSCLAICQTTIRHPHRRHYHSHAYYVIETDGRWSDEDHVKELAKGLHTEFVERVGELDDFWLVRAPIEQVRLGYHEPDSRSSVSVSDNPSSIPPLNPLVPREPDSVIERYDSIRRSIRYSDPDYRIRTLDNVNLHTRSLPRSSLSIRQLTLSVRSLDRQHLRRRHKRDLIYVPSDDDSGPIILITKNHLPRSAQSERLTTTTAAKKYNIIDPLWPKQWHLVNDILPHHMINVTGVWDMGITGKNVSVAIVDDGLDMNSDDLKPNFFERGSWDYNDHTPLPEPRLPDDLHGTRCAGEIAAIRNDVCGVGVAHEAKVAGIRILSASISDADEASALNFGYQENHIYSCSWGPPDDGKSMEAPSRMIFKAMLNGIQKGRDGKGSVFVFASGNGGAVDDQCNFDGYTNSIYSITISAIDRKGLHPYYSEVCSANMAVTYSSGSGDNIHTTDVGKNKCTDRHGGTSAAAPLGAGILALVLEARPELTWRDVQHLVVSTAIPFSLDDPEWQKTATGKWYNHKYGFGNMDAYRIVEGAKTWKLVKPQAWWKSPNVNANSQPVTGQGANSTITVEQSNLDAANFETLEHITVAVNVKHKRRGNVRVMLISPHGTVSVLAAHRRFDEATTGFPGWVFMTVKHWGESAAGSWTLSVQDRFIGSGSDGTFEDWALGLWGECKDPSKQELFKMPDDKEILLPPSPVSGVALETVMPLLSASIAAAEAAAAGSQPTPYKNPPPVVGDVGGGNLKSIARPTDHLPEDHAGMAEDMTTGFGGLSTYLKGKPSWIFGAFGAIVIIGGSLGVWFFLVRMRRRSERGYVEDSGNEDQGVGLLSGSRRRGMFDKVIQKAIGGNGKNVYGFEPVRVDDDLPMRRMSDGYDERVDGKGKMNKTGRKNRTRELYDAFGDGSGSEGEQEENTAGSSGDKTRHVDDERKVEREPLSDDVKVDDEYMDSFLKD